MTRLVGLRRHSKSLALVDDGAGDELAGSSDGVAGAADRGAGDGRSFLNYILGGDS